MSMINNSKAAILVFTSLASLTGLSSAVYADTPSFEDIDRDGNGVIDKSEYEQFQGNGSSAQESSPPEDEISDSSDSSGKDPIRIGKSFIDTANILIPTCTTTNECGNDPATFSYTLADGADEFSVDAAISFGFLSIDKEFDPKKGASRFRGVYVEPVIEADVSSVDAANDNSVRAAVPIVLSFTDTGTLPDFLKERFEIDKEPGFISDHNIVIVPKYEADTGFDTQTIGLDFLYTPTIPSIGIGAVQGNGPLGFRWRPVVGFEFGNVLENQQDLESLPADTFVRFTGRLRAELGIVKDLVFSADYVTRVDLTGNQDFNDAVDLTLTYFLDDNQGVSIGLEYSNGETPPTFEESESLRAFFGFRL